MAWWWQIRDPSWILAVPCPSRTGYPEASAQRQNRWANLKVITPVCWPANDVVTTEARRDLQRAPALGVREAKVCCPDEIPPPFYGAPPWAPRGGPSKGDSLLAEFVGGFELTIARVACPQRLGGRHRGGRFKLLWWG